MPFILIMLGILLFVTAIRGTTGQLASLLSQDVFGQRGFIVWVIAVLVIGAVGYVQKLKGISDAFLVLLVIVLFLSNRGFFAQFNRAIGTAQQQSSGTLSALNNQALGNVAGGAAGL